MGAVLWIEGESSSGWAIQLSLSTPWLPRPWESRISWASFIWLLGGPDPLASWCSLWIGVLERTAARCPSCRLGPSSPLALLFITRRAPHLPMPPRSASSLGDALRLTLRATPSGRRPASLFVLGFWCLDLNNNTAGDQSVSCLLQFTSLVGFQFEVFSVAQEH